MVKRNSYFKAKEKDEKALIKWINQLELTNGYPYDKISIQTSLGHTQVYGLNVNQPDLETLVIFHGYRITALIWDLDRGLASPVPAMFRVVELFLKIYRLLKE